MLKRIWTIFVRDMRVSFRESMTLYMIIAPLLLAVGINLISPGINDTTVNVAMIEGENVAQQEYFDDFAHVETMGSVEQVEERVMDRDNIVGILKDGESYYILSQGNEPESVIEYTKLLRLLYDSGVRLEDAEAELIEFGETVPPLKKMLVNMLLLMIPMISGMLIAINIVEEKADKTIRAINVTPTTHFGFILGKSMSGMVLSLVMALACIFITGFYDVNFGMIVVIALASTVLALVIGFIQGLSSEDIMEAAGSVKLMFLPMAGSVIGYEFVKGGWQAFFWWSPFYWAYRANDIILAKTGTLGELALYVGIIIVICFAVYALMLPRIKKRLQ